jgi:sarcosine oxidase
MARKYDVVVVGVGGMGSAAAAHLAERGADVLGLERFDVPHDRGSSHGFTRIIRLAYFEDPAYVPLLRRAYDGWRDLESWWGGDLLYTTGSVTAGPADGRMVGNARRACERYDVDHEVLAGDEVNDRFPGYGLPEDVRAVYQPAGGFVVPEDAIVAHVERAFAAGAEIHARERVEDWCPTTSGVRVDTDRDTYDADRLVVTAGAWLGDVLESFRTVAVPERQVLGWFQPRDRPAFEPDRFPVFTLETDDGDYYGFPVHGVPGFKLGRHHHLEETGRPEELADEPTAADEELLRSLAERCFPSGAGPTMRLETCTYTNTPDEHFVVDVHPDHPEVVVAGGFSGHGFKFCPVIGEVVADLALEGATDHDVELFRADRF